MGARTLLAATMLAAGVPAIAGAGDEAATRHGTAAEEGAQQGSGTAANAATSAADAGGTSIGSGADTTGTSGIAVEEGTVMRPLSAQGRNAPPQKAELAHRKQLYGLNPKADDSDARGSKR